MSKTPADISSSILATLATTAPGLSCELGTPERKIIDAAAEAISAAYIDQYLVGSLLDIENKSGLELEQFCLVPGTPVTTPLGVKPIETLRVGDEVITHTGKVAEVLATSARVVDEDVVTIRTAVGVEYTMTRNHPVWVTRQSTMTLLASQVGNWRRDGSKGAAHALRLRGLGSRTVWDARGLDRDFVPAGEVVPGDIVWGPDSGPAGTENTLSVALKRLLGYYLAEGHICHRERSSEIGFTFHRNEIEYQTEVEELLRSEWGITHIRRQHPNENSTQLICYNTRLARWLEKFVGKGAGNKHLPFGMGEEDWTPLLATYWRGDGTAQKQSMRAKTVSATLGWQLYDQIVRRGLSPRMTKESEAGSVIIMGRKARRSDTWTISVDGESAYRLSEALDYPLPQYSGTNYARASVRQDGFVGSAVVRVTNSHYRGNVHNIEVAGDNSYELPGSFGVHNCGIFGFARLQGKAAVGVVRLTVTTSMTTDQQLPLGSQFTTVSTSIAGANSPLYFSSTQAVVLVAGTFNIDVPVQCTTVGTAGNVPPGSITSVGSVLATSSATNLAALTGGVDVETDAELRQRFKDTLLRNIAGTSDWYTALALQNSAVSRAVVFGPTTLYRTQIVVPATTLTLPVHQDVKYVWDGMSSAFSDIGQSDETFYSDVTDYTLSAGASPIFTTLEGSTLIPGNIIDLEFQYTTRSSRNDPATGITNKVDLFVDGVTPVTINEQTVVSATLLSSSSASPFYTGNFRRVGSPGSPTAGHRFMRLGSTPIVSFPPTITVGSTVYSQGTHYFVLADTTLFAGSAMETSGIEWADSGAGTDTELTLQYVYNQVPELLKAVLDTQKQICTDVMVHQAAWTYLTVCLSVEYDRSYTVSIVNSQISDRLKTFFQGQGYGAQLKISAICLAVQQVLGVVDVKLTTSSDDPDNYGVQVFNDPTDTVPASVETDDFKVNDNALCVFQNALILRKAAP